MSYFGLTHDVVFKFVFGKQEHEKVLISLLNAVLEGYSSSLITVATIKNPFSLKEFDGDKQAVMDLNVTDENGICYNIEMQVRRDKAYLQRLLYYWGKLYTSQIEEGTVHDVLAKTISISFLGFTGLNSYGQIHGMYRLRDFETKKELTDYIEVHLIELPNFNKNKPFNQMSKLEKWINIFVSGEEYLKDEKIIPEELLKEEDFNMALRAMKTVNNEEQERLRALLIEKAEMKAQSFADDERERLIGIGGKRGKAEERLSIAKNLLDILSDEQIVEKTGLSIEKVKKLRKENS
jgi:predicted transposase/invertase (TIGR01784 family)